MSPAVIIVAGQNSVPRVPKSASEAVSGVFVRIQSSCQTILPHLETPSSLSPPSDKPEKMITFASFAPPPDDLYGHGAITTHHPEVEDEADMDIDFDDEEFASGSKLTCPGETLTSSHAFMRCV